MSEQQLLEKMTAGRLEAQDLTTHPARHTFAITSEQKEFIESLGRSRVSEFNEKLRALIDYWRFKTEV